MHYHVVASGSKIHPRTNAIFSWLAAMCMLNGTNSKFVASELKTTIVAHWRHLIKKSHRNSTDHNKISPGNVNKKKNMCIIVVASTVFPEIAPDAEYSNVILSCRWNAHTFKYTKNNVQVYCVQAEIRAYMTVGAYTNDVIAFKRHVRFDDLSVEEQSQSSATVIYNRLKLQYPSAVDYPVV